MIEDKPKLSKNVRRLAIILIPLLSLIMLPVVLLSLPAGKNWLRLAIEKQVENIFGQQVRIGELETDFFNGVWLREVSLYRETPKNKPSILSFKELHIRYKFWDILQQRLSVKSILIDGLHLVVRRDSSGYFDFPGQLFSQNSDSATNDSSWEIRLEELSLINSKIEYQDRSIPLEGTVYDLNVAILSSGAHHYQFQSGADSISVLYLNETFSAKPVKLEGVVSESSIQLDSLFAGLPELELTGHVLAKLDSTPIPVKGGIHLCGNPQSLTRRLTVFLPARVYPVDGEIDIRLSIEGTADSPRLDLQSDFINLGIAGIDIRKGSAHLRWEDHTALLEQCQVELEDGSLSANGELVLDSLLTHRLYLNLKSMNSQMLWGLAVTEKPPFNGEVSGEIASQGPLLTAEKLQFSSALAFRKVSYRSQPLDDITTTLSMNDGNVLLDLRQGKAHIGAEVDIRDRKLAGEVNADLPQITPIAELFEIRDLSGSVDLKGRLSGTFEVPVLDFEVSGSNFLYWNFPADSITAHLVYQNAEFLIKESYLSARLAEIDTSRAPFDLSGWEGGLSYTARLNGPFDNLRGDLAAEFYQPAYMGYSFDSGDLQVSLDNHILTMESLQLSKDLYKINASGDYAFPTSLIRSELQLLQADSSGIFSSPEKTANTILFQSDLRDSTLWNLDLKGNIDLNILNSLGGFTEAAAGKSSFDLQWNGSLREPRIRGRFDISDGEFRLGADAEPLRNFAMQLAFSDSLLQLQNISAEIAEIPVQISGEIISAPEKWILADLDLMMFEREILHGSGRISPDSIDYTLKSRNLELSLFQPFAVQVEHLGGLLNSTLSIQGPLKNPQIFGNLDIDELGVAHQLLTSPLEQGIVRLKFDQNHVQLDSFFVAMGEGSISASGSLVHNPGESTIPNFRLDAAQMKFEQPENYAVNLKSAQLAYNTRGSAYHLSGDIILGDSRFTRSMRAGDYLKMAKEQVIATLEGPPKEPLDLLSFMKRPESSRGELPAFLQQTEMDIRLHDSDSLWVDNNLARIRMAAELNLIGNVRNPTLSGRLKIDQGRVNFLDRNFEVTRGVLDFADPERANPLLDIDAETTTKPLENVGDEEYEISLKISGPLDDFDYKLTSRPQLEESDIISLLTLGVTSGQLAGEGGSREGITMKTAIQERMEALLSQEINSTVSGYVTGLIGESRWVDKVGVSGNLFDRDEGGVWASKEITDRLELRFTKSFKKLNDYKLQADYRLLKYIFLRGKTNQQNESEGSVKFRLRFK